MPIAAATGNAVHRRRDPRVTYEGILEAALKTMAERGPEGLSVSEVAHRAGVNRTTAYEHFRTREQLVAAVIGRVSNDVKRILESATPLGERIDQMLGIYDRQPEIARLWLFHMLSDAELCEDRPWQRLLQSMRSLDASDRGRPDVDPEVLGCILLGATLVWSLLVGRGPASETGARGGTARFAQELKRLLGCGVLEPEA